MGSINSKSSDQANPVPACVDCGTAVTMSRPINGNESEGNNTSGHMCVKFNPRKDDSYRCKRCTDVLQIAVHGLLNNNNNFMQVHKSPQRVYMFCLSQSIL